MKMKFEKYYLFLCLVYLIVGCSGKAKQQITKQDVQYPITIPFVKGVEKTQEVLLSQIASTIKYIPLETTDKSLISRLRSNIEATSRYIFIPCRQGLMQFSREGKFLRQIGAKGQGPGEYQFFTHYAISEKWQKICILCGTRILCYTLEGTFLNEIQIPESLQISIVNETTIATFIYNINGQEKNRILLINPDGSISYTFPQYDHFKSAGGGGMFVGNDDRYLFSFENEICFKDQYNDTLFVLSPEKLSPRYIFQLGKHGLPPEYRIERIEGGPQLFQEIASSYLYINIFETKQYLFVPYKPWVGNDTSKQKILVYAKQTNDCYTIAGNKIINDIDGGLPFIPTTAINDNTLLSVWEASDIIELMNEQPGLKQMDGLNQLNEESNPVLMIVELKE